MRGRRLKPEPAGYAIRSQIERNEPVRNGGIGGSLFLIALGAILYRAEGLDINIVGLILLIVGGVGLVLTLLMTASAEKVERENSGVTIVER
jgi:hypothetical protein